MINDINDINDMQQDYRYQLESPRVTGRRQQKTTCPQCHRRKCFVRYVDTHDTCRYISDEVGKCDHQHSCGYHYRPSEYYHDHPSCVTDWTSLKPSQPFKPDKPREQPLIAIDGSLVSRSHYAQSTFWQWVTGVAPQLNATPEDLSRVFHAYWLGATHQSDVIFWQIDEHMQVHTGHVMCYDPQGHRQGYQSWTHFLLQQKGLLPLDYQPPKCLFGQHLLTASSTMPVAIVESEKTAVVMALKLPQYLWLATAGCGGLTQEKLAPLQGRKVLVFPDSGCYEKWSRQLSQTSGLDYRISNHLESYPSNTDLADLVLAPP